MDLNTALSNLTPSDIEEVYKLLESEENRKEFMAQVKRADATTKPILERILFVTADLKNNEAPNFLKLVAEKAEEEDLGLAGLSGPTTPAPIGMPPAMGPNGTPILPPGASIGGAPAAPQAPQTLQDGVSRYGNIFPSFQELDDYMAEYNTKYGQYIPFPKVWLFRAAVDAMNRGNDVFLEWVKTTHNFQFTEDNIEKRSSVLTGFYKSQSTKGIELAVEYGYMGWGDTPMETDIERNVGETKDKNGGKSFEDMMAKNNKQFAESEKVKLTAAEVLSLINSEDMFDVLIRHPEAVEHMKDFAKFNIATLAFDVYKHVLPDPNDPTAAVPQEIQDFNAKMLKAIEIVGGLNSRDAISHLSMPSALSYMLLNMRANNAAAIGQFIEVFERHHEKVKNVYDEMGNDLFQQGIMGLVNLEKNNLDLSEAIGGISLLIEKNLLVPSRLENNTRQDALSMLHHVDVRRSQLFQMKVEEVKASVNGIKKAIQKYSHDILEAKDPDLVEKLKETVATLEGKLEEQNKALDTIMFQGIHPKAKLDLIQKTENYLMREYGALKADSQSFSPVNTSSESTISDDNTPDYDVEVFM